MNKLKEQNKTTDYQVQTYLAEYTALSEVQLNAKLMFFKLLILYHTSLGVAGAILLNPDSNLLQDPKTRLYVMFATFLINAFLLTGCGYQLFSFFSIAKYYQFLRQRLVTIVGDFALGYERNMGKFLVDDKKRQFGIESWASGSWLLLPLIISIISPIYTFLKWQELDAFSLKFFSLTAAGYSLFAVVYMIKLFLWLKALKPLDTKMKKKVSTTRQKSIRALIIISVLVSTWMFSTIYHEAGHAFFGYVSGMQPFDFKPYPHFRQGDLYMGYVDFHNWNVSDFSLSVMHIGSEIFQVLGFFVCMLVYWQFRKAGQFPTVIGESPLKWVGLDSFLRVFGLFSYLDWPLYAINHSLKLPHFFLFGGPWWDGDVYLFAKHAGIYQHYELVNIAAAAWLIGAGGLLIYVQYPRLWTYIMCKWKKAENGV